MIGGQGRFEHFANLVVGALGVSVAVALQDSTGVGVDYEYGMLAGVQKNGVGGFRTDATEGEKLIAEDGGGGCKKAGEGASVGRVKKIYEGFECLGFLAEVAGRTEKLRQSREANAA